ncbi:CoB--CoM heterodisulfide reductase iron-sulfur subunit B family protein [Archaeoglobus veneficus]|uniref:CoB--CoM heterodisulfide reductase n=1 Tax=Archaeoglobus veneficus (strain DSM 11195 / SNP6) TaxID=693661 RepID=F2KTA0_ARCVS|nr:CoB--CoM heterodisulfide reductase iron-sulfur subunit B family protein [Archaeoglobus veneficus]AEA47130.1 CoB--CoM heterodisulfide reductase [Archaeoglobus veneficus SNP6]
MRKFAYFPGCSSKQSAVEYDLSARVVAEKLGIELVDFNANCCGTHVIEEYSKDIWLALNARNLAIAESLGLDVLTLCPACYLNMKKANSMLNTELERINSILAKIGRSYCGKTNVFHIIEAVVEAKPEKDVKFEPSMRVAPYYGCQLLRPPEISGIDDPENPSIFEELLEGIGYHVVDFPAKTDCCGATLLLQNSAIHRSMSLEIIRKAKKAGAECIATLCPLCQFSLEVVQTKTVVPVYPFTRLVGASIGVEGFNVHVFKNL